MGDILEQLRLGNLKNEVLVIAEIGNNHNGDMEQALKLVEAAQSSGADFVKFQMRDLSQIYRESQSGDANDLGAEYVIDLLRKYNLSIEQHQTLMNYAKELGVGYLCTPWDTCSADVLLSWDVPLFKISSADFTNLPLLERFIPQRDALHLILSTGMVSDDEINEVTSLLVGWGLSYSLLHTNSCYPAPYSDLQLQYINQLKEKTKIVGYSGHERGYATTFAAIGLGARIVERHITLDKALEGPDHLASLLPAEFESMVRGIREISLALGQHSSGRIVSQGEKLNRETLGKSIVAAKNILAGSKISIEDCAIRSPGRGLSPLRLKELVGRRAHRTVARGDFFYNSDLGDTQPQSEKCKPVLPFQCGIPVRFHDFIQFRDMFDVQFVEFHLSYKDMQFFDLNKLESSSYLEFFVHAPELFADSHLLDLCSLDQNYRRHSISHLQKVIDLTRALAAKFPNQSRPPGIIVNCGGFSSDGPLPENEVNARFDLLVSSFSELDTADVSLLPQTMAPFPWLLGGQQHQNLFLHPKQIMQYADALEVNVCFDTSHTALACKHFGHKLDEYVELLGDRIAHIHIGDASGLTGEGLQIGEGEIDFGSLLGKLCHNSPKASLLPEIWQGHKDFGSGFVEAFSRLQALYEQS